MLNARDFPCLQDALDAAAGGELYLPYETGGINTFVATSRLIISANTKFVVDKNVVIRRGVGETGILLNKEGTGAAGYTNDGNIIVEGGIWDGVPEQDSVIENNIHFEKAENITVRDAILRNVQGGHGIELKAIKNGLVENCKFLGFHDPGDRYYSEAFQLDSLYHEGQEGLACKNIIFQGSYAGASSDYGVFGALAGTHNAATFTELHSNIIIKDNTLEGSLHGGIRACGWEYARITGNTLTDTHKYGIHVNFKDFKTCKRITIDNNTIIRGCSDIDAAPSIYVQGEDVNNRHIGIKIYSNNINTPQGPGHIKIHEASRVMIHNNLLEYGSGYGIWSNNVSKPSVMNNHVDYTGTTAEKIKFTGCSSVVQSNNIVY